MNWRTWVVLCLALAAVTHRTIDRTQNSAGRILDLGFEAQPAADGVLLKRSAAASLVAAEEGQRLRDGDIVQAVTVRGVTVDVPTRTALADALRPLRDGERWVAHVARADGTRAAVDLPAASTPWPFSWLELAIPVAFTSATVLTALLLVWLRPGDHLAFLGAMLFLCMSCVLGSTLQGLPVPWRPVAAVLQATGSSFLPYFFLRFFSLFPSPGWIARRLPWVFGPLLGLTTLAAALLSAGLLVEVDAMAPGWRLDDTPWLTNAWTMLFVSMLAAGAGSLVAQYRFAPSATARRRLGIVAIGLGLGVGPLLAYLAALAIATDTASQVWLWAAIAVVLCLPVFPASFAYAVVRHRVLGVDSLVRRGAQYLLVSRALIALEFVLVFGILYLTARRATSWVTLVEHPALAALAVSVVAAVVLLGALRLNRIVQPAIDRRFFREPYESARVLSSLAADAKRLASDPPALLAHVARVLAQALQTATFGIVGVREAWTWLGPRVVLQRTGDAAAGLDEEARRLAADEAFEAWLGRQVPEEPIVLDATDPLPWSEGAPSPAPWRPSVVVPIGNDRGIVAALLLGEKRSEDPFFRRDLHLVTAAASQATIALDYGRLIVAAAEQEAFRRDLQLAEQVQAHLFPKHPPQVGGLEFAGACQPARTVGGDYYDAVELGGGRLAVAAGDVVGKGVAAALLMASLQATLRSLLGRLESLAEVVEAVNRSVLAATAPGKFATLFVGVVDRGAGTLTYVNAGHNPPLLRRADGRVDQLPPTGMAIALTSRATYEATEVHFRPGDTLLVYTDGVTEAMNADGELFGDDRLAALLAATDVERAEALRDLVLAEVAAFAGDQPPSDDITVAVVRCAPDAGAAPAPPR